MKQLLYFLFIGTKGGESRLKIISLIKDTPLNANQIAISLKLDYKTIQHHLKILLENNVLTAINQDQYGAVYFISKEMGANMPILDEILGKFGKK